MKTTVLTIGILLIVISLMLGGMQLLRIYNIRGGNENRYYFYGAVGVTGLVGIMLAAWSLLKKEKPKQTGP